MIKVLGVGDNVVDKYIDKSIMYPGGNALNVSVYSKFMGMEAAYLGIIGDDAAGKHVYNTVKGLGLDLSHCRLKKGENGFSSVELKDGDRVFAKSNKGGISRKCSLELTGLDQEYISEFDFCHTSIYSYIEPELEMLSQKAKFLSMDMSDCYDEEYLKSCCRFLDCVEVSCGDMGDSEIEKLIDRIIGYGCRRIVIATRGSGGAVVSVDGKIYEQSSCLVKATDTMGAGDSFISSFLVNYLDGMKDATDFPLTLEKHGITTAKEYQEILIRYSLYRAAVFASKQCLREGSFGYGTETK